jgi:hypothetical protein
MEVGTQTNTLFLVVGDVEMCIHTCTIYEKELLGFTETLGSNYLDETI